MSSNGKTIPQLYQEQLVKLNYGIPLWVPEAVPDEVSIGDVGFFRQHGSWHRLFNVLSSESGRNLKGVPERFVPIDADHPGEAEYEIVPNYMGPIVHHTKSVQRHALRAGARAEMYVTMYHWSFLSTPLLILTSDRQARDPWRS